MNYLGSFCKVIQNFLQKYNATNCEEIEQKYNATNREAISLQRNTVDA